MICVVFVFAVLIVGAVAPASSGPLVGASRCQMELYCTGSGGGDCNVITAGVNNANSPQYLRCQKTALGTDYAFFSLDVMVSTLNCGGDGEELTASVAPDANESNWFTVKTRRLNDEDSQTNDDISCTFQQDNVDVVGGDVATKAGVTCTVLKIKDDANLANGAAC